ncbi:MAG: DinB family protein [Rhodothermales bacterium]
MATEKNHTLFIPADAFLEHWQGHRRLTRRIIEAFPEDKFASFSIGGMRPFSELVGEIIGMTVPTVVGVATGTWEFNPGPKPATKEEALRMWDEATKGLDKAWATIPGHRFLEVDLAFGQWEGPGYWILNYIVDNEVHHRGQGYVYLRALGIEPPFFYER